MKLYIIGNGFDIHHGLKTKYSDYKEFLLKNNFLSANELRKFEAGDYRISKLLEEDWSNVEEALCYDFSEMVYQAYVTFPVDLMDDSDSRWDNMVIECDRLLSIPSKIIGNNFLKWISSINLDNAKNKIDIDKSGYFITFNYTKTLEQVYNIKNNQILHLHGIYDRKIQFGNNENNPNVIREELDRQYSDKEWYGATYSRGIDIFQKYCLNTYKDLEKNVKLMKNWLKKKKIDEIVIYGHKILEVDSFYYENYLFKIFKSCKWVVYYHKNSEKTELEEYFKKFNIFPKFLIW